MTDDLKTRTMLLLRLCYPTRLRASTIAHVIGADCEVLQPALHELDDEDKVLMRKGLYQAAAHQVTLAPGITPEAAPYE